MNITRVKNVNSVEKLFDGWNETLIWSCLDGTMGSLYSENTPHPESVMAWLGDFIFFAWKPSKELVAYKPEEFHQGFVIMVPQNEAWAKVIEEVFGEHTKRVTRYAIQKEKDCFNRESLQKAVDSLADEYVIKRIGQAEYEYAKRNDWTCDWCSQFAQYQEYETKGLGFVIYHGKEIVAGASSYSSYKSGIEIEIDTKEEYRRKGLAYVAAAKLILECLDRDLYPSWDAANLWSVGLAQKLGYHFEREYAAYYVYY